MKAKGLLAAMSFLLIGWDHRQVSGSTYELRYKGDIFDDQYIGCQDKLTDDVMPRILKKEKANPQFDEAWRIATKVWNNMVAKLDLPDEFEDEHGIALLVFTNQIPVGNPIYQQLNGNLTLAGASVKDYMDNFHFKALHFYLTRALQILKPDCRQNYTTFRGSWDSFKASPLFRFGRFTSTSLNSPTAQSFGRVSSFQITTCFGAKIGDLSFFPQEDEVLIPPTEKFTYLMKNDSAYILKSTGQMCSYFNCAIMGGEKQTAAVCHSDSSKLQNSEKTKKKPSSLLAEQEERISTLEHLAANNHEEWNEYRKKINEALAVLEVHRQDILWTYLRVKELETQLESIQDKEQNDPITRLIQQNTNILNLLMKEELTKRRSQELDTLLTKMHTLQELVSNTKTRIAVVEEILGTDRARVADIRGTVTHNLEMMTRLQNNINQLQVFRDELLLSLWNLKLGVSVAGVIGAYVFIQRHWQRRPAVIGGEI